MSQRPPWRLLLDREGRGTVCSDKRAEGGEGRAAFTSGCQVPRVNAGELERETGLEPATLSLEGETDGKTRERKRLEYAVSVPCSARINPLFPGRSCTHVTQPVRGVGEESDCWGTARGVERKGGRIVLLPSGRVSDYCERRRPVRCDRPLHHGKPNAPSTHQRPRLSPGLRVRPNAWTGCGRPSPRHTSTSGTPGAAIAWNASAPCR